MIKNKFIQGSLILIIGEILTKILGVVYLIPLYKMDPELGTILANLFIPYSFILIFATIGINNVMTQEVSKHYQKDNEKLKNALHNGFNFVLVIGILSTLFMFLFAKVIVSILTPESIYFTQYVHGTKLLSLGILLFAFTNYLRAVLMGFGDVKIVSISYLLEQIIRIFLILIGVYYTLVIQKSDLGATIDVLCWATNISILSTLILFIFRYIQQKYHKYFMGTKYQFSIAGFKMIFIAGFVYFINGLFITFFDQIDLLMMNFSLKGLGYSSNNIDQIKAIYFTYSLKLIMVPISLSTAFITLMIQQFSQEQNKEKALKIFKIVFIYSIFWTASFIAFGPDVYKLMYEENALASSLIIVQSLIIPFYVMRTILTVYCVINGYKKEVFENNLKLLLFKVIANVIFVLLIGKILGPYVFIIASILSIFITTLDLLIKTKKIYNFTPKGLNNYLIIILKMIVVLIIILILKTLFNQIFNFFTDFLITGIIFVFLFLLIFIKEIKSLI